MTRRAIGVEERPPLLQTIPLSFQHLFAMFGATVLVPILFKVNPATILLFNGIGTLLYLFICKGRIPAYLGSSFAFISPVLLLLPLGYELALGGFIVCGVLFCLVAGIVKIAGRGWINVMFPPAAMGAIVAVIGLELAGTAANMAGLLPSADNPVDSQTLIISMVTLGVTILGSVMFRGFLAIIPILIGVLAGYALSFFMGVVDVTPIKEANWFALPTFYSPRFEWSAIFIILPAALVVIAEHVGHLVVTANIVQRDLMKTQAYIALCLQMVFQPLSPDFLALHLTRLTVKISVLWLLLKCIALGSLVVQQLSPSYFLVLVNWQPRLQRFPYR